MLPPYHFYSLYVIDVDTAEIDVMIGAFATYSFPIYQEKHRFAVHSLIVNACGLAHTVVVKLYTRQCIFQESV